MRTTLLLALSLTTATAFASSAITSVTGGGSFGNYYGDDTETDPGVVGYKFTVSDDVFVTALGVYDDDASGDLAATHQVGIWQADSGTLVASSDVGPTGTVDGDFIFESISNAMLTGGREYIIGATYWAGNGDAYISGGTYGTDGMVTLINAVYPTAGGLGFVMPGNNSAGNAGRVGPNFQFEAVPEPATMTLLGLGALVALKRRKKA